MALHPATTYSLWKVTYRKTSSRPLKSILMRDSILTIPSSVTEINFSFSSKQSVCNQNPQNFRSPVAIGVQMEAAEAVKPTFDGIPTVVEFSIPPESLVGFEADYEKESAAWPADLATTTDDAKIEQFVTSAHSLARRWLPQEVVSRLESFPYDPNDPPAMVIRGLPIDKDLPPTGPDAHVKKTGKCVSETWLVGIARIVGQVFTFTHLRGSRTGMGMLVREIYTTADKVNLVGTEGSREYLDFHVDAFHVKPEHIPHIILFIGVRGDLNKEGKTLVCSNRKLYRILDPANIQLLRTEKVTWDFSTGDGVWTGFSKFVIDGPETNPHIYLFEENLPGMGFEKVVKGSPEVVAAYKRAKDTAASIAEGVWLSGGDVLLLNQKKASHGRSPYQAKYDGHDRWLQRTYVNNGRFWEAGSAQWPNRSVPFA